MIKYWFDKEGYYGPGANPAIYVSIVLGVIIAINYFGVGIFGEFEFWLSSVKVLIMLGLIIFTLVLAVNGGPSRAAPGFDYLVDPGAFAPYLTGTVQSQNPQNFICFLTDCLRWKWWEIPRFLERPLQRSLLLSRC